MKTTEPDSQEPQEDQTSAAEKETPPPGGFPDPGFPIEGAGGPIDGEGDPYTGPPKKREN